MRPIQRPPGLSSINGIGTMAYVVLFVDLRNRREGADLGERIDSLETNTA